MGGYLKGVGQNDEALLLRLYPIRPAYPLVAPIDRVDAGEDPETLAGDLGLESGQIEDAVFYERPT
ncbi:MAG: hypothetical protein OXT72_00210 [Gammaproteobacteria bacterium]|nr:hypothetical protein [Gammaproteobacteria bacterium]MDE0246963.1 hypothetical protein [Gammaproteobacteria bacterium]